MKNQSSFNTFLVAMGFILCAVLGSRALALDFDTEINNQEAIIDQVKASLLTVDGADSEPGDATEIEGNQLEALEVGSASNQDGLKVVLISKK